MPELSELLLGGPGHDGYAYNADVYCVECGQDIIRRLYAEGTYAAGDSGDTDQFPQPIFFGESDCAQHCADCHEYLYGPEADDEPADEPEEGDYTTSDHVHFYQYGKLVLTVPAEGDHVEALAEHMNAARFYPSAWFISDHGNAHRIDVN